MWKKVNISKLITKTERGHTIYSKTRAKEQETAIKDVRSIKGNQGFVIAAIRIRKIS
jgi:hypothetical protein